ncbi:iron-containing redox enzyme family protein, partial [Streptomyces mirabilis]
MDFWLKEPPLPPSRGPISTAIAEYLRRTGPPPDEGTIADASPFGEDWQLGLYLCYELHYRGFTGVDAAREWDPDLLKARAALERPFLKALRHQA